jgi:hypothetical protein
VVRATRNELVAPVHTICLNNASAVTPDVAFDWESTHGLVMVVCVYRIGYVRDVSVCLCCQDATCHCLSVAVQHEQLE